jgi:hypothetical protein
LGVQAVQSDLKLRFTQTTEAQRHG